MLKKLFISLIILSALTSDGAIYLHGNAYDFGILSSKTTNGLQGVSESLDENLNGTGNFNSIYGNTSVDCSFILTSESLLKLNNANDLGCGLKDYEAINNSYSSLDINVLNSYQNTFDISFLQRNKELILEKSDTSPPFTNI